MSRETHCNVNVIGPVRAAFIMKGTTLTHWCRGHHVDPSWAWKVLKGEHLGAVSQRLRRRIIAASGFDELSGKAA